MRGWSFHVALALRFDFWWNGYLPFLGCGSLILDDSSLFRHDIHDSCCGLQVFGSMSKESSTTVHNRYIPCIYDVLCSTTSVSYIVYHRNVVFLDSLIGDRLQGARAARMESPSDDFYVTGRLMVIPLSESHRSVFPRLVPFLIVQWKRLWQFLVDTPCQASWFAPPASLIHPATKTLTMLYQKHTLQSNAVRSHICIDAYNHHRYRHIYTSSDE